MSTLHDFQDTKPPICDNKFLVKHKGRGVGRAGPSNRDVDCFVDFRIRDEHLWIDGDFTGYAMSDGVIDVLERHSIKRWLIYEQDTRTVLEHTVHQLRDFGRVTGTDDRIDEQIIAIDEELALHRWDVDECNFRYTPNES